MSLVPDELRTIAHRFPDRAAVVVDHGGSMTFAEWDRRSDAVGRALVALGVRTGDRVALLLSGCDALVSYTAYMATQKAGGVAVPVNPRLAAAELAGILASAGPAVIVAGGDQLRRARKACEGLVPRPLLVGPSGARVPVDATWEALEAGRDDPLQVPISESDLADILYTSGTTGQPKGVASTHENVLGIPVGPSEREDALLHAAPLGTMLGTYGTMLSCLRLALTNVCLPAFDTSRFAELIGIHRPGWLMLVPAQVQLLRESGALDAVDTSSVWIVLFGSAPMAPDSVRWLAATFPKALVVNAYSLTESGDSACLLSPDEALTRPGSVGKPIAGAAVRAVDEHGHDVPPNEVGELLIRIRSGKRFYFGNPGATAETWRGGWVHTGDLGYLDPEGFVYVVDRKKDMIIRGGYNVYSVEVENALHEHPAIVEAAVLGVPHRVLGQDILAVVRLSRESSLELAELRAFLTDRLADYKQPRHLVVTDQPLPRNSLDKVDKAELRRRLSLDTRPAA